MPRYISKMNDQTVRGLRDIAKEQSIFVHYKLKTAELIALLSKQSTQ